MSRRCGARFARKIATWMSQRTAVRKARQSHAFDWPVPGECRSTISRANEGLPANDY